jgi:hypothetical protein
MYDFLDLGRRLDALQYSEAPLCEEELEMMRDLETKNAGLLKRYLMLVCNSFEVLDDSAILPSAASADEGEAPLTATTTALYFRSSFFNHSCAPNCDYRFDAKTGDIRIHTNRDVPMGEELTIGYCLVPEADEDEDEDEEEIRMRVTGVAAGSAALKKEQFRRKYGVDCFCASCCCEVK